MCLNAFVYLNMNFAFFLYLRYVSMVYYVCKGALLLTNLKENKNFENIKKQKYENYICDVSNVSYCCTTCCSYAKR